MLTVHQIHRPSPASRSSDRAPSVSSVSARGVEPAAAPGVEPCAPRTGDAANVPQVQHGPRDVSRGPLFVRDRLVLGLDEEPRALRDQEARYLDALPAVVPAVSAEELQVMRALAARIIVGAVQVGEITEDCIKAVNHVVKGEEDCAAREQKVDALLAVTRDLIEQLLAQPNGTEAERSRAAAIPARELWRVAKGEYVPPHMMPFFERGLREDPAFASRLPRMVRSRIEEIARTEPTFADERYTRALTHGADVVRDTNAAIDHATG